MRRGWWRVESCLIFILKRAICVVVVIGLQVKEAVSCRDWRGRGGDVCLIYFLKLSI